MNSTNDYNRWTFNDSGGINWNIKNDERLPHTDFLEMSGRLVSLVVKYGVDINGDLVLAQNVVWPNLRLRPNDTHASLIKEYKKELLPSFTVDGVLVLEKPYRIEFDGILAIKSILKPSLELTRTIFPSTNHPTAIHRFTLTNTSLIPVRVGIGFSDATSCSRGVYGIYQLQISHTGESVVLLNPKETISFGLTFSGRKIMEPHYEVDITEEEENRRKFLSSVTSSLRLETPEPVLNQAFDFAKIRSAESVFETKSGLLHSPGGLAYYAAVWTNDEAEYAGPFFPFLGDANAIEASINCYRLYRPFMGPEYTPIPSSIIAEGQDFWEGAGDRGDAAMYAYGAARFLLALGDKKIAKELFPTINWCLEYCQRKITTDGVIASDSDELEGRFPAGDANLATSSLAYGALLSAANLARELGYPKKAAEYETRAKDLDNAIENYFGAKVEGYDTYRYFDGNKLLRSWICLPLTMGIMKRKNGTLSALFSPRLWTEDGLATQAGDETFWDRSTLYGFRGAFCAGETETTMGYFVDYSKRRTLGDHVPYAVEAYPEGNQRHLSAESALYCRVITEGLFGITPTGFNSFFCSPRLPKDWTKMVLYSMKAFGKAFDLLVARAGENYEIVVTFGGKKQQYICPAGETVQIFL
ncbi:MAG: hypothetical protein PHC96_07985 [Firmicutes bacterium]|nr:hypothetical protein [Bacillota bacterium]